MNVKLKLPHPLILIFVIGFLLYARTLSYDYTNFDDNTLVQDNQNYIKDISNIPDAFKKTVFITGSDIFYRPLETIWLILNAQVGGQDLFFYHLSSLLLHFFAVYLIFILLNRLNNSKETSLFLSLVFLVHPLFAQAVAWVPGVVDVLVAVFSVSSFLFFLDFVEKQQRKYFVLHLLFFALALYTKEIAVGISVVCILYLFLIQKEKLFSYNQKVLAAGWIAVFVVWLIMRNAALQGQSQKGIGEMILSIMQNLPVLVQYMGKVLLPFNLAVMPVMADTTFVFGIISLLVFIITFFYSKDKRKNRMFFSFIWFVVFLLPTLIQTSSSRIHQEYEHRMYLPVIGILFFAAETDWLKRFTTENKVHRIVSASILLFFFVIAFRHVPTFADTRSFLENAVRNSPSSSLAHRNMGIYYQDKGLLNEALEEYQRSLALNPNEKDLHNNMGVIYDSWGKKELAENEYLVEAQLNPANSQALHNLGVLYAARNEYEKAKLFFNKSLAVRQSRGTYEQLALLLKKTGDEEGLKKVIAILRQMDAKDFEGTTINSPPVPGQPADPIQYGRQLMQAGKLQEADAVFKQLLVQDSMNTQALFNLGLIYYSSRQLDAAEALWRRAVLIDPTFTDAYNNLAISLAQQGKYPEAEVVLKKIIVSNPDYIDGYFNMANFYARTGKEKEALYYVGELKKRGVTKEQFLKRGIKLSPELEKIFE